MARRTEEDMLVHQAKAVLDFNWTGEYTMPGPRLYPHQWSWDSAFIAIGYSHFDQDRATRELRHLFEAQWKNGLLPQIVFNPHFTNYFPGPNFWHAKESPYAPQDCETSGVVLPPVHATAALCIYRHAEDEAKARDFLGYAFPKLGAWHDYLYRERDPEGEGLVYIRHPWESGMDNSPLWDQILQRLHLRSDQIPRYHRADIHTVSASDRPTSDTYDRFAYLVKFFADRAYDEAKIRQDCPFLVQDVLFNSLLSKAERDLAEIARILGEDPSPREESAAKTSTAIEEKLWDENRGTYLDYDLVDGRPIRAYFGPNLAGPLYAGIAEPDRAKRVVDTLENDGFGLADKAITPYSQLRSARFRVLGREILAGSGLDQHKLVLDARVGSLRLPGSRRAPPKDHHRAVQARGLPRILRPHYGRRTRFYPVLLVCGATPGRTLGNCGSDWEVGRPRGHRLTPC